MIIYKPIYKAFNNAFMQLLQLINIRAITC